MRAPTKSGILWIVVGLLAISVSLHLESIHFNPANRDPSLLGTCIKVLDVAGIGLLAIGVLNILLETRDWRNYFSKLLREIVVEQSYLDTLDKDKLTALQTNVLKALFKDQLIDREGSFLNYFHLNLHKYIAEPYREDVSSEISISDHDANLWDVVDKVTYICRKFAGTIQPNIVWCIDEGEYENVESVIIEAQYPYNHPEKGKREELYSGVPSPGQELTIPLKKYAHIDGLVVTGIKKGRVLKKNFQHWTMAHPTKNFSIAIIYPASCSIQVKPLVLNPELLLITERTGYYSAKYDSWMLPESGMAFRIKSSTTELRYDGNE
jgi:hypothetical protein